MAKIDLNLVRTLITLYETRSVTLAAEQLFITQPTVSYSLSRLREIFNDQLFVRTKEGMEPTPYAHQLYQDLSGSLEQIETAFEGAKNFDPASTEKKFTLALTDLGEISLLPKLFRQIQRNAPDAVVEVIPLEVEKIVEWMSGGRIDACICTSPINDKDINQQLLFEEQYNCVMNPRNAPDALNMQEFLQRKHVVVSKARGHGITEEVLQKLGHQRKVSLVVPHFTALPPILAELDLIAIVPRKIAYEFSSKHELKVYPLPFDVPTVGVTLYWSKRTERSQAINWLREQICDAIY